MALVKLETNKDKDIYTVKMGTCYHGVVVGDDTLYVTEEAFESPLKAANAARKLKRENKIIRTIKKKRDLEQPFIQTKITRVEKLYTEAEVAALTHLRFRETWVILSPNGEFVKNMLKDKNVVNYCKNKSDALTFTTYEDASVNQKTLNLTVRNGHYLRRFFVEKK